MGVRVGDLEECHLDEHVCLLGRSVVVPLRVDSEVRHEAEDDHVGADDDRRDPDRGEQACVRGKGRGRGRGRGRVRVKGRGRGRGRGRVGARARLKLGLG